MNIEKTIPKDEKRTYWQNHIKQWSESGLSLSHYCQHNLLKLHQLYYWKQVFSDAGKTKKNTKTPTGNGFVAIQVTPPSAQPLPQGMIIQLPNGIRIENSDNTLNSNALIREMAQWKI